MGIYSTKAGFQARFAPAIHWLAAHHVSADALTLSAVLLAALGGGLLAASPQSPLLLVAVPFCLLGRLMLNVLDGQVARATGTAHPAGELFNEFADRVSDLLVFGGLAWACDSPLGWAVISLILLSSYVDILGKSLTGQRTYAGIMGKGDRMIWLSLCALAVAISGWSGVWTLCWVVLAAGALVTTLQRLKAIRQVLP
ncbi:MAG: CDP-alcohol phosphatidyltransferase family protein [Chloroflexi bacterium]|nr:CDP-alcohol phosphatidyltransferase family protein [Chloroflexota bacterium]